MATSKKLRKDIERCIIEGVRRNGERIFAISQENARGFVPVDAGYLKQSGYIRRISGGIEMGYRARYAAAIEYGTPEVQFKGTQTIKFKKHRMLYHGKKVWVKAHEKKYVNRRLLKIRPHQDWSREEIETSYGMKIPGNVTSMRIYGPAIWRVVSKIPARQGQYFLKRAALDGIKKLPDDLKWALSKVGQVS